VLKSDTSDARKLSTPHCADVNPRSSATGGGDGNRRPDRVPAESVMSLTGMLPSLVIPVGIVGVLEIPEGPTTMHRGDRLEVVSWRRRRRGPFQRPRIPRVIAGALPFPERRRQVVDEDRKAGDLNDRAQCGELVPDLPSVSRLVGVDAP